MPGFHMEHFGCRAARADGEAVGDRLRAAGLSEQPPTAADLVVVNTCSVTAEADRSARAFIRRAHRLNPEARIVVTGCYAQRAPEELAGLAGVAAVVGNSHKALAPEIILRLAGTSFGSDSRLSGGRSGAVGRDFSPGKAPADSMRALAPEACFSGDLSAIHPSSDENADQSRLISVQSLLAGGAPHQVPIWADDRFAHSFLEEAQLAPGAQTRPNLKIQEGCGNRCTFCVIPQTRGSSKSLPAEAVLRQVEGFMAAGGNELVLSGINLGRWGRDLSGSAGGENRIEAAGFPPLRREEIARMGHGTSSGNPVLRTLAGLVRWILEQTTLPRLRLSSIEPMDWGAELIGLMAEFGGNRLARHAHLPLQSGSDAVLRRMHRRYRPWHYVEKVEALLRAAGPELTLGADVMVGFPGETEAEFEETRTLIEALPFGYLHLFPFSPRPGTPGWALHAAAPVPAAVVEQRMAALRALASHKSQTHRKRFIGKELEAITLHTPPDLQARVRTAAMTENFLPVEIEGRLKANRLLRVRVTRLTTEGTLEAALGPAEQPQYEAASMSV
jgi:threonylcarbamoyladenosine tRNA methylthiotransferase MtaB